MTIWKLFKVDLLSSLEFAFSIANLYGNGWRIIQTNQFVSHVCVANRAVLVWF
jgi:hypothetical protein